MSFEVIGTVAAYAATVPITSAPETCRAAYRNVIN
jgi:hypothetical protein